MLVVLKQIFNNVVTTLIISRFMISQMRANEYCQLMVVQAIKQQ